MNVWLNPDFTGKGTPPSFVSAGQFKGAGTNNVTNIKLADMDGMIMAMSTLSELTCLKGTVVRIMS